jgi:hypothetical protein
MKSDSIMTILSLVATCDMEIVWFDIKITFLYGEISKELYID